MAELTKKQQLNLIDLVESVVDQIPIPDSLIKDLMVVYRFLVLSKDQSAVVFSFVNLLTPQQKSELTRRDVLTEEVMLELHLIHGFDQLDLVQWLRWIDFGGMCFFNDHAHSKNVLHLDQIMDRARLTIVVIDGVRIDSVLGYFESLDQLIEYTINERITFKQFRQLLVMLNPTEADLKPLVDYFISDLNSLKKITRASQVLPFRMFCSFFDFLEDKQRYLTGIAQVFDQLIASSSLSKTFQLLNQMPYPIILFIVKRLINQNSPDVIAHLNEHLAQFEYGMIRKIVRRNHLGLNYKYD